MKILTTVLFFLLMSCSNINKQKDYCISDDNFDIKINSSSLSNLEKKILLNDIINNSTIKFNEKSDFLINLNIAKKITDSLISDNNESQIQNVIFTVRLNITDKNLKKVIYNSKIIIVDSVNISENRFSNYTTKKVATENFSNNFSNKLQNKIEQILKNNKCSN